MHFFFSGYEFYENEASKNSKEFPFRFLLTKNTRQQRRDDYFNALNDFTEPSHYGSNGPYRDAFFEDEGNQFKDHRKKSDARPKYDPGWKFIGLGKRPETYQDSRSVLELENPNEAVNPLLGISTLINFEFFNAFKDKIEDVEKDTVKKEHWAGSSRGVSAGDSGSQRYNNKLSLYTGRQKTMYDPGWMLTGLGK